MKHRTSPGQMERGAWATVRGGPAKNAGVGVLGKLTGVRGVNYPGLGCWKAQLGGPQAAYLEKQFWSC